MGVLVHVLVFVDDGWHIYILQESLWFVQILGTCREHSEIQGHALHSFNFKSSQSIVGSAERPAGPDEGWDASVVASNKVSIRTVCDVVYIDVTIAVAVLSRVHVSSSEVPTSNVPRDYIAGFKAAQSTSISPLLYRSDQGSGMWYFN